MVCKAVCRRVLIPVCFLLGLTMLGGAQSGKQRPQDPRGIPAVPAPPTAAPGEPRTALVMGMRRINTRPLYRIRSTTPRIWPGCSPHYSSR